MPVPAAAARRLAALSRHLPATAEPAGAAAAAARQLLLSEVGADGIATVTLNRPEAKNAMTFAMIRDFREAMRRLGADPAVRVIILTGSGDSFCTGTDLKELSRTDPKNRFRGDPKKEKEKGGAAPPAEPPLPEELRPWWWVVTECPKPVICALNGMAVGMGAEFTTLCDVRILSDRARVCWVFGKRGLVPDMGVGTWLLPKIVGYHQALRLLYAAEFHSAAELKALGYAHEVVPHSELMAAARKEATRYLPQSPLSLRLMKRQVYLGLERSVAEHQRLHHQVMQVCFASDDHREGVASFVERRPAKFTGEMPGVARTLPDGRLL